MGLRDILRNWPLPPFPGTGPRDAPRGSSGPSTYVPPHLRTEDPWDPRADPLDPGQSGSLPADHPLSRSIAATQAHDCADCPVCGFLRDGRKINASFPFRPAMDYQNRVVRLPGMFTPPFLADIAQRQIEEWHMPDSASGAGRSTG